MKRPSDSDSTQRVGGRMDVSTAWDGTVHHGGAAGPLGIRGMLDQEQRGEAQGVRSSSTCPSIQVY